MPLFEIVVICEGLIIGVLVYYVARAETWIRRIWMHQEDTDSRLRALERFK